MPARREGPEYPALAPCQDPLSLVQSGKFSLILPLLAPLLFAATAAAARPRRVQGLAYMPLNDARGCAAALVKRCQLRDVTSGHMHNTSYINLADANKGVGVAISLNSRNL